MQVFRGSPGLTVNVVTSLLCVGTKGACAHSGPRSISSRRYIMARSANALSLNCSKGLSNLGDAPRNISLSIIAPRCCVAWRYSRDIIPHRVYKQMFSALHRLSLHAQQLSIWIVFASRALTTKFSLCAMLHLMI